MKISIITVCYNSEQTIEETIKSVFTQTYPNVEYIIVDGNSKDATLDIIKKYDSKIFKWVSESDKGIYDALNKGVEMATGDVIGFVHSDDLLSSKDTIVNIANIFKESEADGVYGDLVYVNKFDLGKIIRKWKSQSFSKNLLKRGWMPAHPTLFLKRHVYEKHGLFDLTFKIAGDYDFMLRALQDSDLKFAYLPEVITKMRVGGASNRSLKNIIQKSIEDYRAIKKNKIGFAPFVLFIKNISKISQFFLK